MRRTAIIWLVVGIIGSALGQAPQGINYQGVARDSEGKPVASRDIAIRATILNGGPNDETEYAEVHEVMTNQFGLFTIVIGQGQATVSNFNFIGWANGSKWLQIEMDINGGRSFQLMGSQQLMSVPYALYAQYAGNSLEAGQGIAINNNRITNTGDADSSPTNELNTSVSLGADHKLRITDAGGTKEADLSPLLGASQNLSNVLSIGNNAGGQSINNLAAPVAGSDAATKAYVDAHLDGDSSPTNEIQDLSLTGNTLKVTNNAAASPIDLSPYLDNTDSQDLSLNLSSNTLQLTGDGTPVNLTPYLDNTDNQDLELSGDVLSLTGDATSVNLSGYRQTLSKVGNTLNISGATSPIDLTPYLDNTDAQGISLNPGTNILSISGNASIADFSTYKQSLSTAFVNADTRSLTISNGNSINVDVRDADASPTNEIQDLSLSGNTLSLSGDGTPVDLTPYVNTDNQNLGLDLGTNVLSISGGTGVNLASYRQDLSLSGNTLSLTGDATTVDLSGYVNTDNQTLTYTGATKTLSVSGGNSVVIPETQNISQVLANGNNTGGSTITGLPTPSNNADAAPKIYVDDAEARVNQKISSTYAFRASYNHTHSSSGAQMLTITPDFDDFTVISSNQFTAPENGVFQFTVSGACSATSITMQLRVTPTVGPVQFITIKRQTGYPDASTLNFYDSTLLKLSVGDKVDLIISSGLTGEVVTGSFFGFKL